jgi:hypothetical protein
MLSTGEKQILNMYLFIQVKICMPKMNLAYQVKHADCAPLLINFKVLNVNQVHTVIKPDCAE